MNINKAQQLLKKQFKAAAWTKADIDEFLSDHHGGRSIEQLSMDELTNVILSMHSLLGFKSWRAGQAEARGIVARANQ